MRIKRILFKFILIFVLQSCIETPKDVTQNHRDSLMQIKSIKADSNNEFNSWGDSCTLVYLKANKDRLTQVDGYDVTYTMETAERYGRIFMVRIGHNFENNFQTDQWIYIDSITKDIYEYDLPNDSLIGWPNSTKPKEVYNVIPPNGRYIYDVAFAEWEGKSMGAKVIIEINGNHINVINEGSGHLTLTKKGEIIEQGIIIKHKYGVWIIGEKESDAQLNDIGGCSGGPSIIDFKNKKYWMC